MDPAKKVLICKAGGKPTGIGNYLSLTRCSMQTLGIVRL